MRWSWTVAGPARPHANPLAAFATARERAALLGGTLHIESGPAAAPRSSGYRSRPAMPRA